MTTLTQPTVSRLLDRLFAEADAAEDVRENQRGSLSPQERAADRADYLQFYARMEDQPLPSRAKPASCFTCWRDRSAHAPSSSSGRRSEFRHFISRPRCRDNGGGRLIGSEFEPSKIARARKNIAAGGLSDLVEIREGDALETLARDLPDSIDFVLLDGAKNLYPAILSLLEGRLRAGALIVADNADASPEYLARVRSTAHGYLSVPFGDDVELSMRLGPVVPQNGAAS